MYAADRYVSLVTIAGTVALLVVAILALVWAQKTFRQMELDFRFTSPADQEVLRGTCIVDGIFSGQLGDYTLALDGEDIDRRIPFALDTAAIPDGTHALSLHIQRGGTTTRVAATVFTVDNNPPSIVVSSPADGSVVAGTVVVESEIRGAREDTRPRFALDGVPRETLSSIDTRLLAEGAHSLVIEAEDSSGNVGEARVEFVVDNTPPRILSIGIEEDARLRGEIALVPGVDESNPSSAKWFLDGLEVGEDWDLRLDTAELDDGNHRLELIARDKAGAEDSLEAVVTVDNTPPPLHWALRSCGETTVYRDQRLPLGITSEAGAAITVRVDGVSVEDSHLTFSGYEVGESLSVDVCALDPAGNVQTLAHTVRIGRDLSSRLMSLWIVAKAFAYRLGEPLRLLFGAFDAARPSFSFEYCPPATSPYWIGARAGIDLPSSELYIRLAPVPGFGFSIPLAERTPPSDASSVGMTTRLGFGFMGTGILMLQNAAESDDELQSEEGSVQVSAASSAYAELLFCWDLTPIMVRDYSEVSLGFRLGLTDVLRSEDGSVVHRHTPAASLVLRVKAFFW